MQTDTSENKSESYLIKTEYSDNLLFRFRIDLFEKW